MPRYVLAGALLTLVVALLAGCQRQDREAAGLGAAPPWTQPEECRVAEMSRIATGGGGFDWSPDNKLVALTASDDEGVKQIYTVRPDGSDRQCVTCVEVAGGPPVRVHKGVPYWHPSGDFLLLQVEMEEHPLPSSLAEPGSGWLNNIWAMTPDGQEWWQLTDYGTSPVEGVLFPRVSADGGRVAWAKLYRGPDNSLRTLAGSRTGNPWGRWQLNQADLVVDEKGPRLENVTGLRPGDGNFYEMQAWSPDGRRLLFAADIGRESPYVLDVWELDLDSGELRALTDTDQEWEEQATYSPSGNKVVYMSSECCDWDFEDWKTLATELYLVNRDGSQKVQLTEFNTADAPQFTGARSIATMSRWSADGTRLLMERIVSGSENEYWMLTFQDACGLL